MILRNHTCVTVRHAAENHINQKNVILLIKTMYNNALIWRDKKQKEMKCVFYEDMLV